jgi:hypothetical protein
MKWTLPLVVLCLILPAGCSKSNSRVIYPSTPPPYLEETVAVPPATQWDFDKDAPGQLPPGWRVAETKSAGTPATWAVEPDPTAPSQPNVLAVVETRNTHGTFNLALAENTSFKDLDMTVKLKANTGQEDQGGGPVWRAKEGDDYYVCRLNPLESNFRVYKVVNGKRTQLATADTQAKAGEWHTIRAVMKGDQIECYLDGQKLLESQDDALPDAGMIGLWSKADAATAFDSVAVTALE